MATFNFASVNALVGRLSTLAKPDPRPLLARWAVIIEEDNRRGVLAGTDKDGVPLEAVTYRPVIPEGKKRAQRWTQKKQLGHMAGAAGAEDNNLSSTQYRRLGGPPLAPRGASSRVITNLETDIGWDSAAQSGFAEGAWKNVVSKKGVPFLLAHFTGAACGRKHAVTLKVRDLRGVRPWGRQKALRALQEYGRDILRALYR